VTRDIPIHIVAELMRVLAQQLPHLKIKFYDGSESFDEIRALLANAKIVIGQHGAGFVNLVFCQEFTPVVEFVTNELLDRPWQMFGGHSFQLSWWPVLVSSFSSRDQIMGAVPVIQAALKQAATAN
jgi:hypothetical protein